MRLLKWTFCLAFFAAVVVPQPVVKSLTKDEKAPSFSSPRVKMHENGDRISPYPPYYHPERGGK